MKNTLIYLSILGLLVIVIVLLGMNRNIETNSNITIEAGQTLPDVSAFIVDSKYIGEYDSSIESINTDLPDTYKIDYYINKKKYTSTLTVQDTTPPIGSVSDQIIWLGEQIEIETFINDYHDLSPISYYYGKKPNFDMVGVQTVEIILMDNACNQSRLTAKLIIKEDKEAPTITGVKDITIQSGDRIAYKRGVVVTDNRDKQISINVDNSLVNTKLEGKYPVTYTAKDLSGNTTQVNSYVIVEQKIMDDSFVDLVKTQANQIINQIIHLDMTDKEKLWAVFKWSRNSIEYTGYSDKTSWLADASRGMKTGSGDCYTYYAVSRALLEELDFDVIPVIRSEVYNSKHYWLLVNYNSEWYHFDSCPALLTNPYRCFLKTDEEINEYTESVKNIKPGYYVYDKDNYPVVSKNKIDKP